MKMLYFYSIFYFTSYSNYLIQKTLRCFSLVSLAQNVCCDSLLSHKNESHSYYIHH